MCGGIQHQPSPPPSSLHYTDNTLGTFFLYHSEMTSFVEVGRTNRRQLLPKPRRCQELVGMWWNTPRVGSAAKSAATKGRQNGRRRIAEPQEPAGGPSVMGGWVDGSAGSTMQTFSSLGEGGEDWSYSGWANGGNLPPCMHPICHGRGCVGLTRPSIREPHLRAGPFPPLADQAHLI